MGRKRIEQDEPNDTEGNLRGWSDAEIKHDVTPLAESTDEPEDTEGNIRGWSDAEIKHDVTPLSGSDVKDTPRRPTER